MLNVAVLVSGGGTNLQALLDSEARGENPNGKITLVLASKPGVYALERAAKAGVEGVVVRRKDYENSEAFDAALLETLKSHNIDLVVLAGFLSVLGPSVIGAYPRRTPRSQSGRWHRSPCSPGPEQPDGGAGRTCRARRRTG